MSPAQLLPCRAQGDAADQDVTDYVAAEVHAPIDDPLGARLALRRDAEPFAQPLGEVPDPLNHGSPAAGVRLGAERSI